jgi:glycosyltransferase involved in cell wall biosynthesis
MNKRVLFLVACGSFWPGGVRRVLDYLPLFRADGFVCDVKSYENERLVKALDLGDFTGRLGGLRRVSARLAYAVLNRVHRAVVLLSILARARRLDWVFVQSIPPPEWWVNAMKRAGPRILFDFDDAVFLHNPPRVGHLVTHADLVTVGSHFNLAYAQKLSRRVVLLPTPVPLDQFQRQDAGVKRSNDGHITIGWVGGTTTTKYLELLREPLTRLAEQFPGTIRFVAIGSGNRTNDVPRIDGMDVVTIPRIDSNDVPRHVRTFDIGVMPLFDGEWERGKCSLKLLEYMAAGVPAVGSAVGENLYVIDDGVNGCLASNADEWVAKLAELIRSPERRKILGGRGQQTVRERYSTEVCYDILRNALLGRAPALAETRKII